jgi:hypothetical protein
MKTEIKDKFLLDSIDFTKSQIDNLIDRAYHAGWMDGMNKAQEMINPKGQPKQIIISGEEVEDGGE